jgi:hypothetical protein
VATQAKTKPVRNIDRMRFSSLLSGATKYPPDRIAREFLWQASIEPIPFLRHSIKKLPHPPQRYFRSTDQ